MAAPITERNDVSDIQLDNLPRRPPRSRDRPLPLRFYQRIVANPFLAALGLLATVGLVAGWPRQILGLPTALLIALGVLDLAALFLLLQYHCLDCGATGWLPRWRRHACDRVRQRVQSGRDRRFRGPTPGYQNFFWLVASLFFLAYLQLRNF